MTLDRLIDATRLIVVVGPGGVGKTTSAAAIGVAAARRGRQVCLVTVDPARRLADTLGGPNLGPEPTPVAFPDQATRGGALWAMMLDPATTFDRLITLHAPTEQADVILQNRFYRQLATSLPGIGDYMAVEQLHLLQADERFDLVVVDTPPADNVLDLVDAPERLTRFMGNRLYRALATAGRRRVTAAPTRALLQRVGEVVGTSVLDEALGFFAATEGMEQGFVERASTVRRLMADQDTATIGVVTPRPDRVRGTTALLAALAKRNIEVRAIIANQLTFDPWEEIAPWRSIFDRSSELLLRRDALADRHQRSRAESAILEALVDTGTLIVPLHRRTGEINDIGTLTRVGDTLLEGWDADRAGR